MNRPSHNHSENNDKPFSILTRLLLVMVPILILIGVYSYKDVFGNFIFNTTILRQQAGQNIDLDYGLVAHYTFDGPDMDWSSTTAEVTDTSGNGNNGNLVNSSAAATTLGKTGQAMSFDGVNQIISAPYSVTFNSLPITISTWFKGTSLGTGNLDSNNNGWDLYKVSNGVTCSYLNTWNNRVYDETNFVIPSSQIFNNNWHFITCVIDSTGGKLYLDGILIKQLNWIGTPSSSASNLPLHIGQRGYYTTFTNGVQDDVRIYNRALSADEVYKLYTQGGGTKINTRVGNDSLTEGLVGYWKLDEGSGTTAADSSGNGNNATASNSPSWVSGKIGNALNFSTTTGSKLIATTSTPSTLDTTSHFSISMWFKGNNISSIQTLLSNGLANNNKGFQIQTNTCSGSAGGICIERNSSGNNEAIRTTGPLYTAGTWNHLIVTVEGTTVAMYLNNVKATLSGSWTAPINSFAGTTYQFGAMQSGGQYWDGSLDEILVYNRILTTNEIQELYRTTQPSDPDTSLVGHWTFDGPDISSTTAYDRSGKGNNATLISGPTKAIGKIGQGMRFDGVDDYGTVPDSQSLSIVDEITISAWVKWNWMSQGTLVGSTYMASGNGPFAIGGSTSNKKFRLVIGKDGSRILCDTVGSFTDNEWIHVTGTYDGTENSKLYINGALNNTCTSSGFGQMNTYGGSVAFALNGGASRTPGVLDDVRIYNRALSADEIADLYSKGEGTHINTTQTISGDPLENGLVGHWTFDGKNMNWSSTTAEVTDTSGNGYNGNANFTSQSVILGKIGQALKFSHTPTSYVSVANNLIFDIDNTESISVSLWFREDSFPGSGDNRYLFSKGVGTNVGYYCTNAPSEQLIRCGLRNSGGAAQAITSTISLNTWYHLVFVIDGTGSGTGNSYVDGTASTPVDLGDKDVTNAGNFMIGYSDIGTAGSFTGSIDDVRVYDHVLTADEVQELYNRGK